MRSCHRSHQLTSKIAFLKANLKSIRSVLEYRSEEVNDVM